MVKTTIELGFGVSIERIVNNDTRIHNLKSDGKPVSNLGVRIL